MRKKAIFIIIVSGLVYCSCRPGEKESESTGVIPSPQQVAYQQMELIGFIHFSINTFTDKEWGYGDESPALFNPTAFDADQWARTAKNAGMKQLILTAKHHDGFCLWPTAYTEHSVKNSPWKNGKGDMVREFTDACRLHGLKAGLYLSPWDRNHKDYGTDKYLNYYRNQLTELLTDYGEISEIWFDGANGGDGYYGGANKIRKIDRKTYYDWDSTFRLVYSLQPDIIIFSDAGPGCRWIGNEHGIAGETNWSTINKDSLTIGGSNQAYLNVGDQEGTHWIPGECDVSIRPGWFYHSSQDSMVKTLEKLKEIYYGSVGRNGVLLLNIPPDQRGLIHESDVSRLSDFSEFIQKTFTLNLASDASAFTENLTNGHEPDNMFDGDINSYWEAELNEGEAYAIIELPENRSFDLVVLGENITDGQKVSSFEIEVFQDQAWQPLALGTTIGYKRILKTELTQASRLKLIIKSAKADPMISTFGLYREAIQTD